MGSRWCYWWQYGVTKLLTSGGFVNGTDFAFSGACTLISTLPPNGLTPIFTYGTVGVGFGGINGDQTITFFNPAALTYFNASMFNATTFTTFMADAQIICGSIIRTPLFSVSQANQPLLVNTGVCRSTPPTVPPGVSSASTGSLGGAWRVKAAGKTQTRLRSRLAMH